MTDADKIGKLVDLICRAAPLVWVNQTDWDREDAVQEAHQWEKDAEALLKDIGHF